jgi:Domain of unknown function (DUF4249)
MKKKHKNVNSYHFPLLWRGLGTSVLMFFLLLLQSCIQDIDLSGAGGGEYKIVIEGKIENGKVAEVFVMRSAPLASTKDYGNYAFLYDDATVTISDGTTTEKLKPTVTTKPPSIDLHPESTYYAPYLGSTIKGTPGKTYTLTVIAAPNPDKPNELQTYTATTTIPMPVKLDSVWWVKQAPHDTLGYAYAHLTEPAGKGNAYRWSAKRANKWYEKGEKKDRRYLAPLGATFDDQFIDGTNFDMFFARGTDPSDSIIQEATTDINTYFKQTDTIYTKFCTMDKEAFKFYSTYEAAYQTNGNPFASPVSIISNISNGGLGIWAGFGCTYDTIYPK